MRTRIREALKFLVRSVPCLRLLAARRKEWLHRWRPFRVPNIEGLRDYDVHIPLKRLKPGVSAMIRAKNEAPTIVPGLTSILDIFDEIVIIDNGSTDDMVKRVKDFKSEHDDKDIVRLYSYPFSLSRFGPEHEATPANSVHSIVHYSNWCISKCTCRSFFKWDADMILIPEQRIKFKEALRNTEPNSVGCVRYRSLYRHKSGNWYWSPSEFGDGYFARWTPNCAAVHYEKLDIWERLHLPSNLPSYLLDEICVWEIKDASRDELANWSTMEFQTRREQLVALHLAALAQDDLSGTDLRILSDPDPILSLVGT